LRRSWTILAILIILLGLIIAVGYLGGPRGAVLATAGVLIMATVARLLAQYRRRSSAPRARADVAHACTALASYLRVGQVPSAALAVAAADCNVLREGQQAHTLGGNVVAVWRQQAQHAGHRGLLELARAWQISMVQGLRHPAAEARDVRRSELQMLARAVGVRSVLPMMVLHHFVCIGLTRDLPHLRRGMPRGCSQPGARLRGQLPTSRRVLDFAPPRHSTMTKCTR